MKRLTTLEIITTGGTIDKTYDEGEGTLDNRESMIRERLLQHLRLPETQLVFHELFSKDSLYMTDGDRSLIVEKIKELLPRHHPILIIHGTDTMTVTAERVFSDLPQAAVPIIFTGAMAPAGFTNSDAIQNLTEAIFAAKISAPGVYICFHSTLHKVPGVRKDYQLRTFVSS